MTENDRRFRDPNTINNEAVNQTSMPSAIRNGEKVSRGRITLKSPINRTPLLPIHFLLAMNSQKLLLKAIANLPLSSREPTVVRTGVEGTNLSTQPRFVAPRLSKVVLGPSSKELA